MTEEASRVCQSGRWLGEAPSLSVGHKVKPCKNKAEPDSVYCTPCGIRAWARARSVKVSRYVGLRW